jgi:hypothetical protein
VINNHGVARQQRSLPGKVPHAVSRREEARRRNRRPRGASALGVPSDHPGLRANLSPQYGRDQPPTLTCPPNIVRTEHNAFVRANLRLVLKSVLEARRGRWVWPTVVRIETHKCPAGQKASSEEVCGYLEHCGLRFLSHLDARSHRMPRVSDNSTLSGCVRTRSWLQAE